MMKKALILALMAACADMSFTQEVFAQDTESAAEAVANMRLGWNLGNTLDSNSGDLNNMWIEKWSQRLTSDYETAWGQPVTRPELFKMFKDAGFNAIRIPVTWYPHMEAKFDGGLTWDPVADPIGTEIQADWMKRVHEIVDYVVSQDMYCILNIHHDTGAASTRWLVAGEKEYAEQKERFEAVWTQIAEEFKDYDYHLLFEGYNEMLDPYNSWCFASFGTPSYYDAKVAESAYNAINSYAQSFVNAVRATGGNNATRNLIVTTYGACCGDGNWNVHLQDPLKQMQVPEDDAENHIIFEVHSYPHLADGLSNAKNSVNSIMRTVKEHLASKDVPVIFGEWGTDNGDDYKNHRADMVAFVRYFVEQAKDNGFATFYWMGLSDGEHRSVPEFNQKDLVEAMAKGYYGEEGYNDVALTVSDSAEGTVYYDLFGNRHKSPVKGVNIVRMSDGTTKKILQH
ncbi:MAG: glycoside hydrolase family 5 protein [Muribaculaceae bacterium]|nr:glycoside hydrolase family 5 protein [Muribaculaceae bacterium]